MICEALGVVTENLDYPTFCHLPAGAVPNHAAQLGPECLQTADALLDPDELTARDRVRLLAGPARFVGQVEELPDRLQRKPELAGVPDEGQPLKVLFGIAALSAGAPLRLAHQSDLLVITDCLNLGPGAAGQGSDRKHELLRDAPVTGDNSIRGPEENPGLADGSLPLRLSPACLMPGLEALAGGGLRSSTILAKQLRPARDDAKSPLQKALWVAALAAVGLYLGATAIRDYRESVGMQAGIAAPRESAIKAEFTLTDHRGERRQDEEFEGKWLLVFFGFTNCPDVCPLGLATIADVMDSVGEAAEKVQPLFISIDPERDTPEAMAEYVSAFHPNTIRLTGSTEDVAEAAGNFRAFYQKSEDEMAPDGYAMSHTSSIYLIGPEGRFVTPYGYNQTPDEIVADLGQRLRS